MRDAGGIIHFRGRIDRQVNVGGMRVDLDQLEAFLGAQPGVATAIAASRHRAGQIEVLAWVTPSTDDVLLDDDLLALLRSIVGASFPAHFAPRACAILREVPLNRSGKVDRKALVRCIDALPATRAPPPRFPALLRQRVAAIWREVLGVHDIDPNMAFFDGGGSSVELLDVHARLEHDLGRKIPTSALFSHPTIRSLSAHLEIFAASPKDGPPSSKAPIHEHPTRAHAPIAVIAMAGRFPGSASLEALWDMVKTGGQVFAPMPAVALTDAFSDAGRADDAYVPVPPGLADIGQFDAGFLNMTPREAALTDPQYRIFLEICRDALESAGIDPFTTPDRVCVFAGCSLPSFWARSATRWPPAWPIGSTSRAPPSPCNRPVHVASGRGAGLPADPRRHLQHGACGGRVDHRAAGTRLHAPRGRHGRGDGVCRPLHAAASGTVFASGAGAVLLKRLADAQRDGDTVRAVIRGAEVNNDGRAKAGFTAPGIHGQAEAIRIAHRDIGVTPAQIGYVECHGTATPLGDPVEFAGLEAAFGSGPDGAPPCALGSLKGTLGHMDAAAGVCGLIETILSLRDGTFPPMPGFATVNPHIDLTASHFAIPDTAA